MAAAGILCIAAAGCSKHYSPDKVFLESSNISLRYCGSEKITYDPATFQIGFSPEKKQFRVHNDTMSEFFTLTCSELPVEPGQKIKCAIKYTNGETIIYKSGLSFTVEKVGENGMVWLWCSKKDLGVTVRMLR